MDFFFFKKFIGVFFMPLPIILLLLCLAMFYLVRERKRAGFVSVLLAALLLVVTGLPSLPNGLLRNLETYYPQYDMAKHTDTIVVLGCGHVNDGALPITSQLASCSLIRASEAIRIYQQNPRAKIITSGNVGREPFSNAYMTKQFLLEMGIPANDILAVELSRDTEEEAQNLARYLTNKSFALVTSASHMQRAITLFKQQGLSPLPAPTDHLVKESAYDTSGTFQLQAKNIGKFERWWYEMMGQAWQWFKSL